MDTPVGGSPRVLIVEDDASLRRLLEMRLSADGHEVRSAGNGSEALEVLRTWTTDAIVSDVMMPRMSGLSLCRAVREDARLRHTPIILLTAACFDADMQAVIDLGGISFMNKPFEAHVLRAELAEALRGSPPATPASPRARWLRR